jgi:hypothetical protein
MVAQIASGLPITHRLFAPIAVEAVGAIGADAHRTNRIWQPPALTKLLFRLVLTRPPLTLDPTVPCKARAAIAAARVPDRIAMIVAIVVGMRDARPCNARLF